MSGTDDHFRAPFDDIDELDAYIDARNAGQRGSQPAGGDLAALFDTVERVRSLRLSRAAEGEPERDFPDILAANLERDLKSAPRANTPTNHRATAAHDTVPNTLIRPAAYAPIPIPVRGRRDWMRPAFQFVAAVVAFALVAGVLAAVLRGGDEPGSRTGTGDATNDAVIAADGTPSPTADTGTPAAATTPDPRPTPDENGRFTFESWEQAAQVAAFDLQQPFNVPVPFTLLNVTVERDPNLDASDPDAFDWVNAWYVDETSSSQFASIQILQTLRPSAEPAVEGMMSEDYLLNDVPIRKWTFVSKEVTYVEYRWMVDDVTNIVSAPLVGPITDPVVESFVASIGPVVAEDMRPTPEAAPTFSTWSDAQQAVYFSLAQPANVLESVFLDLIEVAATNDDSFSITAWYRATGAATSDPAALQFSQRLSTCTFAKMGDSSIDVEGLQVRRVEGLRQDGTPHLDFEWQAGPLCLHVRVTIVAAVTEQTAVDFIASIPVSEATPTPTVDPISFFIDHATVMLSKDYGWCDDPITISGRNFVPGSTVGFGGGPFPGHDFGVVADDVTVADDGTFATPLRFELFAGDCNETAELRDGSMFTVFASTGSRQTKSDDPTGPSAGTVFTLSRETPDAIRNRAPMRTCGTDSIIMAWDMPGEWTPADQIKRECFFDAWRFGQQAEFVSHGQTIEGDIVTDIYRVVGDGTVKVYHDATRDAFGSGTWTVRVCGLLNLGDAPAYELELTACSEEATVE